jgi:Tfp pilus assembly protein PilN
VRAVNLIPADQRSGASVGAGRSGGAAYAVLALVAGLAVMALLYGLANHQISSRKAQAAALTTRAQAEQAAAARLAPYTNFIALRTERTQAVETLVNSRFDWAHVFHEFGRVFPIAASISSLTGTIANPTAAAGASTSTPSAASTTVASVTPPGSVPTFTVTGCATSQAVVAETLTRLRLMDGVSNVTLQSSTKASSGGGSTAGGCPGADPSFALTVTFQPLPSSAASAAAVAPTTVAATSSSGSGPAPAAKSGGSAR